MNKKTFFMALFAITICSSHIVYGEKNSNIQIRGNEPWLLTRLIGHAMDKMIGHRKFHQVQSEIIRRLCTAKQITLSEQGIYQAPFKTFFTEYATKDENSIVINLPARIKHLHVNCYWYQDVDHYTFRLQQKRYRWFPVFGHCNITHPLACVQKSIDYFFSDIDTVSVIQALAFIIAVLGVATFGIVTILCAIAMRYWYNYKTTQYTQILEQIKALPHITREEQFLLFVATLADVCPQAVTFGANGRLKASSECSLETIALEFFDLELTPEQLTKEYLLKK